MKPNELKLSGLKVYSTRHRLAWNQFEIGLNILEMCSDNKVEIDNLLKITIQNMELQAMLLAQYSEKILVEIKEINKACL